MSDFQKEKPRKVNHGAFLFDSEGRGFCQHDRVRVPHGEGRVTGADVPAGNTGDTNRTIRLMVQVSEPKPEYRGMVGRFPRHVLCYWLDEVDRV